MPDRIKTTSFSLPKEGRQSTGTLPFKPTPESETSQKGKSPDKRNHTRPSASSVNSIILVIHEDGKQHVLRFEKMDHDIIIGRDENCDVSLSDLTVTGRHAKLIYEKGIIIIEDHGSKNGTFVNGEQISGPNEIQEEDRIAVGNTIIYLRFSE